MKKLIPFLIIALAGTSLLTSSASADHPHRHRVKYRKRVIVVDAPPPVRRTKMIRRNNSSHHTETNNDLSIGLRFNGTSLDGQKLGLESVENPAMGGIGVQLRTMTSDTWGLELSADFLTGNDNSKDYTQSTVPVMLSALYYPFPNSPIKPYALAGAGVHFTNLSYKSGLFEHHILELAGQLGGGVELQLGRNMLLHADLRLLTVYKNLGSVNYVSDQCIQSKASGIKGFCNGLEALDTNDKFNIGAQFQAGVSFFF